MVPESMIQNQQESKVDNHRNICAEALPNIRNLLCCHRKYWVLLPIVAVVLIYPTPQSRIGLTYSFTRLPDITSSLLVFEKSNELIS